MLENVGFRYCKGQTKLGAADERRINTMLVAAVEAGRDGAIGVATQPGSCVLAVDFFVRDLELADRTRWAGSSSQFRRSLGSTTLIFELRDSQSEEPLARFIERRDLGGDWWKGQKEEQLQRLARAIGLAIRDKGTQPLAHHIPDEQRFGRPLWRHDGEGGFGVAAMTIGSLCREPSLPDRQFIGESDVVVTCAGYIRRPDAKFSARAGQSPFPSRLSLLISRPIRAEETAWVAAWRAWPKSGRSRSPSCRLPRTGAAGS